MSEMRIFFIIWSNVINCVYSINRLDLVKPLDYHI